MQHLRILAGGTEKEEWKQAALPLSTQQHSWVPVIPHSGEGTAMQGNASQSPGKAGKSTVNLAVEVVAGESLGSGLPVRPQWLRSSCLVGQGKGESLKRYHPSIF